MFESGIIEITIGLVFTYLLFSLFVTIANELIATIFKLRAGTLKAAIKRMLDDKSVNLSTDFFNHPSIRFLSKKDGKVPSYLRAETFSKVVTEIVLKRGVTSNIGKTSVTAQLINGVNNLQQAKRPKVQVPTSPTQQLLLLYATEADNGESSFQEQIENWFNETMERASGWYNRKMKLITGIVSFVMVCAFNADTFTIYQTLSSNVNVREEIVNSATAFVASHQVSSDTITVEVQAVQDSLVQFLKAHIQPTSNKLQLGWSSEVPCTSHQNPVWWGFSKFFGLLFTTLAISLGAPFWFDLLNRLINLRGTGKAIESNPHTSAHNQPVG